MKLFKTTNMEIVRLCQTYLCFELPTLPSVLLKNRTEQFRKRYAEYHYTCYNTGWANKNRTFLEIPYFCSHYRYNHVVFAEVFRNYWRKQQATI